MNVNFNSQENQASQELMYSPHLTSQGVYEAYGAGQQDNFNSQAQNSVYNNASDYKSSHQALNANVPPWESNRFSRNSPQFKPQNRNSNYANPQVPKWNSYPERQSKSVMNPQNFQPLKFNKNIWNLIKGNFYESQDSKVQIRDVWQENLESEMDEISAFINDYKYIALSTEFPGIVAKPISKTGNKYSMIRCNVDLLNVIQIGLTLGNDKGEPVKVKDEDTGEYIALCWQFHFKFSLSDDIYSQESVELLQRSGLDFSKHENHGILVNDFGALLTTSGLVLMEDVTWISFDGGYDFAYLLKILTNIPLPQLESDFVKLLNIFFANIYDLKVIKEVAHCLYKSASILGENTVGPEHQAGTNSYLTLKLFWKLKLKDKNMLSKIQGSLFGIKNVINKKQGSEIQI